jgi:hypothetical protein
MSSTIPQPPSSPVTQNIEYDDDTDNDTDDEYDTCTCEWSSITGNGRTYLCPNCNDAMFPFEEMYGDYEENLEEEHLASF